MDKSSGVGVVDKTVSVISAVSGAPCSLAELVSTTGLPRPTAHRLAVALEHHGLLDRDDDGRFILGPIIARWSTGADPWLALESAHHMGFPHLLSQRPAHAHSSTRGRSSDTLAALHVRHSTSPNLGNFHET